MKKVILLLIVSICVLVTSTSACECEGEEVHLKELLTKSKVVFLGKVISIKDYKPLVKPKQDWDKYYLMEFQLEEVYKGDSALTISLIAEASDCGGDEFMKNSSYVIFTFLNEQENKLEYHQCFKMALPKEYAKNEIRSLKAMNKN